MNCFEKAVALIFNRDFDSALQWTEQALLIPNCQYWALAHQAVALAYLDRLDEAKLSLQKAREQAANFSLAYAEEKMFYLKKQDQIDLYLNGLQLAGIEA